MNKLILTTLAVASMWVKADSETQGRNYDSFEENISALEEQQPHQKTTQDQRQPTAQETEATNPTPLKDFTNSIDDANTTYDTLLTDPMSVAQRDNFTNNVGAIREREARLAKFLKNINMPSNEMRKLQRALVRKIRVGPKGSNANISQNPVTGASVAELQGAAATANGPGGIEVPFDVGSEDLFAGSNEVTVPAELSGLLDELPGIGTVREVGNGAPSQAPSNVAVSASARVRISSDDLDLSDLDDITQSQARLRARKQLREQNRAAAAAEAAAEAGKKIDVDLLADLILEELEAEARLEKKEKSKLDAKTPKKKRQQTSSLMNLAEGLAAKKKKTRAPSNSVKARKLDSVPPSVKLASAPLGARTQSASGVSWFSWDWLPGWIRVPLRSAVHLIAQLPPRSRGILGLGLFVFFVGLFAFLFSRRRLAPVPGVSRRDGMAVRGGGVQQVRLDFRYVGAQRSLDEKTITAEFSSLEFAKQSSRTELVADQVSSLGNSNDNGMDPQTYFEVVVHYLCQSSGTAQRFSRVVKGTIGKVWFEKKLRKWVLFGRIGQNDFAWELESGTVLQGTSIEYPGCQSGKNYQLGADGRWTLAPDSQPQRVRVALVKASDKSEKSLSSDDSSLSA